MNFNKYFYNQNWNIGFTEISPEAVINNQKLPPVKWLKHSYRDRWFADPFILEVSETEIIVFVEECPIVDPKGIICELVIDRLTMKLKKRYVLLELDTHLSYPFIIKQEDKIFVCPENGASGSWNIYEFDNINHRLIRQKCLLKESVADASILIKNGKYYMAATKFPDTQNHTFLYEATNLLASYHQVYTNSFANTIDHARPAGAWITINDKLYRPAQDCSRVYGGALAIMDVKLEEQCISEQHMFTLFPNDNIYRLGLHTINFCDDLCVIDGCSYLYPFWGKVYDFLRRIKHIIIK